MNVTITMKTFLVSNNRRWYTTVESEAGVVYVLGDHAITHLLETVYELSSDEINDLKKLLYDNGAVMFYMESA